MDEANPVTGSPQSEPMADDNLPHDLISFLGSGDQLSYDASACEAGKIHFLPVDKLVTALASGSKQSMAACS